MKLEAKSISSNASADQDHELEREGPSMDTDTDTVRTHLPARPSVTRLQESGDMPSMK